MSLFHLTENTQILKHFTRNRHLLQKGTQQKGKNKTVCIEEPPRHVMRLDERFHDRNELLEKKKVLVHVTISSDKGLQQLCVSDKEKTNIANSGDSSKLIELREERLGRGPENGAQLTNVRHL